LNICANVSCNKQESLADAKVSARMNAPSEEIYSKSTAFNGIRFPIMVNSNRSRVAYRLRDIFYV